MIVVVRTRGVGFFFGSAFAVWACTATTDLTGLSGDATASNASSSAGVGGAGGGQAGTGGMGDGGECLAIEGASDVCNDCLRNDCTQTACPCSASPDCVGLLACYVATCPQGVDDTCAKYCMALHPGGISKLFLLNHCAIQSCPAKCPVDESWALTACSLCTFENCEVEANACMSDSACYDYVTCRTACPRGDRACLDECYIQHPVSPSLLTPLMTCVGTNCPSCPT